MEKEYSMFANRLDKMYKHVGKWARKQNVTCYRIYDHDVPQFPFAIDKYEEFIYVSEYVTGYPMSNEDHNAWLGMCLVKMVEVLEVPLDSIFYKTRERQKGRNQYKRYDDSDEETFKTVVNENGLRFIVNLTDYVDTGLFLDHRNTRQMVREKSAGKSVLNLFAYTGAFSVYAAAGAAAKVTTIDLSNTYLNWAKENFKLNELYNPDAHLFVQADVKDWLAFPKTNEKYDIIVMDPPTFSNSKRMLDVLDVQRDHDTLINQAMRLLNPDGLLYFSTNYRRFDLDVPHINCHDIRSLTAQTIPNDFRDKKIHQCYLLKKS